MCLFLCPDGPDYKCDEDTEFSCKTNYRCIPQWARCDGTNDCIDNSDEQGCGERLCRVSAHVRWYEDRVVSKVSPWPPVKSSSHLVIYDLVFKQSMWPVILWEISDVTTTAVSQSAGSVMAITTAVMAQMRGTAVSILLCKLFIQYLSHDLFATINNLSLICWVNLTLHTDDSAFCVVFSYWRYCVCVSHSYPAFNLKSQGLALKVSFDVTALSASLETGCVTMTTTAGTTQMSGTVVSCAAHKILWPISLL